MNLLWLALGAGATLLAMGRWNVGLAAWLGPVFLLHFLRESPLVPGLALAAAAYALVYNVGWYGIFPYPFRTYIAITGGIGLLHFLPFALTRLLQPALEGYQAILFFPLAWAAGEYLITKLGFGTWTHVGYSQYRNGPFLQLLSITGLSGLPFVMGLFAVAAESAWANWPAVSPAELIALATVLAILLAGAVRLSFFLPKGDHVRIASITVENLDSFVAAWAPLQRGKSLTAEQLIQARTKTHHLHRQLLDITRREAEGGAKIVLWSEGNALVFKEDEAELIAQGQALAAETGAYLFLSMAVLTPGSPRAENKTVGISPAGTPAQPYLKARPTPWEGSVPGNEPPPVWETEHGRIGWAICYDYDFPPLLRQAASADILLNPAWDSPSMAPIHTHMAAYRGIELGTAMVRHTNDGLSLAVDHLGNTRSLLEHTAVNGPVKVMTSYLPCRGVSTVYGRVGDWLAWVAVIGTTALTII